MRLPPFLSFFIRATGLVFSLLSCIYMMAFFIILSSGQMLVIEPDSMNPIEVVIAFVAVLAVGHSFYHFLKDTPKNRLYHRIVSWLRVFLSRFS